MICNAHTENMNTPEEYQRLKEEHTRHSKRLDEIGSKRFPTPEEQNEEIHLKKEKLHLKDRMQFILKRSEEKNI